MMARRNGLGKGLDSLIGGSLTVPNKEEQNETQQKSNEMMKIRLIEPNRNQPRKQFDEDSLMELAESIKLYGVIQPIIVCKKDSHYEIIAGERRWRAAKMAGLKEVPVIVKDYTEKEIAEISLVENLQRDDLNPIEEAKAYERLIKEYQLKQEEVAERVAKSRTVITNSLRLLKLSDKVQTMLMEGLITVGHAKVLLGISSKEQQEEIAEHIIDEKLSVRELENYIKAMSKPKKNLAPSQKQLGNKELYHTLEEKMKECIGTKVHINRKEENKGRIEIDYYSADDLERIIEILGVYQDKK
ncbi:MAG TPA: ParB/RepB/Spo0J family partition protein [Candidatus Fimimorpha faecalis]|uniref:ParB/RepB/Spo0J family partition protein n=1 Tax=Candidatus Fimimorpha faecalis TaxID=2840824 RepID=A0A9D1EG67_9FIRM|nr:ParB/RepB/Spo0J family partition protein [Candidatus Fimimorpha faecalis]